jgi:hypothetical protein
VTTPLPLEIGAVLEPDRRLADGRRRGSRRGRCGLDAIEMYDHYHSLKPEFVGCLRLVGVRRTRRPRGIRVTAGPASEEQTPVPP